ncbi:MAG TPA: cytochrome c [Solirubrobacterales bacterium]
MSTGLAWFFGIGIGFCVLVLMVSAYTIGVNVGEDRAGDGSAPAEKSEPAPEPQKEAASAGPGRELFVSSCGSCHTLAAAGTTGTTGPDLDTLGPDDAQVLAAIENGGAGSGAMPAGILEGKEAEEVAAYVSASAGR